MVKEKMLLNIEGLGINFQIGGMFSKSSLRAVHDVSFSVNRGEIVALVGESGSGKSTIARLLCRLDQPTSGRILLDGDDILKSEPRAASREYRQRMQMIFQDPFGSLNPVHTVAYHVSRPLALFKDLKGKTLRQSALELLNLVGLTPAAEYIDKYPHSLSGGQRQRVAIARALAVEPDIICADEPTSMLDVSIRMDILSLLQKLRDERGTSFIFITHDLAAARQLADRILVLYAGQLVEEAPSDLLISEAAHPYSQLLVAAAPQRGGRLDAQLPAKPGMPQNVDPKPHCPFAPRCLKATDICKQKMPEWSELGAGRRVRCFNHKKNEQ
jgi:peptide/nickel transport system ATP-binding protein